MKINKKAFTLIELLAVIVILAIIALIATPIILGIIKDTKKEATLRSAENYLSAVNNSIASLAMDNKKIEDKKYDILPNGNICLGILVNNNCSGDELNVEVEGEKPISGTINIEKGLVVDLKLVYKSQKDPIGRDDKGNLVYVEDIYKKVNDSNPGYICGEGDKEDLTQTTCYIKSIEDLVALSTLVNKGNTFEGKKIELVNSLDFNNQNSYASKQIDTTLITGEGFKPIYGAYSKYFKGIFEGNNNTIKGLYINRPTTNYIGLFGYIDSATIKNLNIESATVVAKSNSGILIGYNNGGTIENINLNDINLSSDGRHIGSLVGNNQYGTIKNIKSENINVQGGQYYETGGLIGLNKEGTIENITLNNISMVNETYSASGLVGKNELGTIKKVKASNINISITTYSQSGGLIGGNSGTVQDVELENIEITGQGETVGGLIGSNSGELVENIRVKNIKVTSGARSGGLIGQNSTGTIKKIIGNNIKMYVTNSGSGGLTGTNTSGTIQQIKLTDVYVEGKDRIGGLVGSNETGTITNSKIEGNVKGLSYIGLIVGYNGTGTVNTVVAKGNIEGTGTNIGGLVGRVVSTSEIPANISGVYLSGSLTFSDSAKNNRTIGDKGSYSPIFKTLASSNITINGNIVNSTDISSVEGKSLAAMGKVSQSEYEAIGFEFESTDTNECYWYFDDNDELDLKIK